MTEMLQQPYTGPSAWTRPQMEADKSWIYTLSPAEVAEIRAAVATALATGKPLESIARADFPLANLAGRLAMLGEELENGRGFEMWRGLPVEDWSLEERSIAYWGLGQYLGDAVVQNARGELFGHVRDTTAGADPQTNANTRFYHTNRAAPFHVDGADIVGLMCVRTAKAGGASLVVSSTSIYNEPLWFDHRGEHNAVTGKPYWVTSICGWTHGKLSMMYLRNFIESAQRYEGAPPLTARHSKLLELIDHYAESPELCLSMAFLPGDIQWLNNHMTLHSRTEFLDWEENERRRWLMRLWLNRRERNRYTDTYGYYGIAPDAK